MKGDFSKWRILDGNLNGVLHQQGRVLLDRDWNDQTQLTNQWQDRAARDIIGPHVLAIPAHTPNAMLVTKAEVVSDRVKLGINAGHGWANGLAVHLTDDPANSGTATVFATYLPEPFNAASVDTGDIGDNVRDAVVLEVWREALNAFQVPQEFIEPALGGVDTTERVHTGMRFRLLRLEEGDRCNSLGDKLDEDLSGKGRLTVTLQPTNVIAGDCPVVEGGGYVGFEHALYRVEIAETDVASVMFKWSQFNGGLVGRGTYNNADQKFTITDNDQAIKMSGLTEFYLEVVRWDQDEKYWRVIYGAEVTLNDDDLEVTTEHFTAMPVPQDPTKVFFRLWNKIEAVSAYPVVAAPAEPKTLADGIRLEFDGGAYVPGDFWTFEVRAGEIANPDTLIDNEIAQGTKYHRVPVAILNWTDAQQITIEDEEIEDCRDVFRPLTKNASCCTFSVGDGVGSFGDFNSLEEALRHLPDEGGELCLLPGLHEVNAVIQDKQNIKISGCGKRTQIIPRPGTRKEPLFLIYNSQEIKIEHLDLVTLEGTAVWVKGSDPGDVKDIEVAYNRILAFEHAVRVENGIEINIHHNKIRMLDKEGGGVAVHLLADDCLVERNDIAIIPAETVPETGDDPDAPGYPDPSDVCADPESVYGNILYLVGVYLVYIWALDYWNLAPSNPFQTLGGILIAGGSERVAVRDNLIVGGAGNGITLGTSLEDTKREPPRVEEVDEEIAAESVELGETANGAKVEVVNDFRGKVVEEGAPVEGFSLTLESEEKTVISVITDEDGWFFEQIESPGTYQLNSLNPGYKVVEIRESEQGEFGKYFEVEVEQIELQGGDTDFGDVFAFIYDVSIERNQIANMGGSGIGVPTLGLADRLSDALEGSAESAGAPYAAMRSRQAQTYGALGGFIVRLEILGNLITRCLQMPLSPEEAVRRGGGGISLGFCADLTIRGNRIQENGIDHIKPVCGIFLSVVSLVEISDNKIRDNGKLDFSQVAVNPQPGVRGGIVVQMATSLDLTALQLGKGQMADIFESIATMMEGHAARIQHNYVEQPMGRALTVSALGPMAVHGNQFNTTASTVGSAAIGGGQQLFGGINWMDVLAGAVMIFNLGGMGAMKMNRTYRGTWLGMPPGDILFNDNQTRLGHAFYNFASQLLFSASDIGLADNQSNVLSHETLLGNTAVLGATVRASGNRFVE